MTFPEKLKRLRGEKGITQSELADAIFISRSMIAKYESGLAYPTKINAEKIADYFNIKLSELISEEDNVQITLDNLSFVEQIHSALFYASVISCIAFVVLAFIPFLSGYKASSDGSSIEKVNFVWSLFSSNTKNGNPIAIITIAICLIDAILWVCWKVSKNNSRRYVLLISASTLFVIIIFLIILTFVFASNYSSQVIYGGFKA